MFFVLTRYKTVLKIMLIRSSFSGKPGKRASGLVLSLAQIKLFSIFIIDCLSITFVDKGLGLSFRNAVFFFKGAPLGVHI